MGKTAEREQELLESHIQKDDIAKKISEDAFIKTSDRFQKLKKINLLKIKTHLESVKDELVNNLLQKETHRIMKSSCKKLKSLLVNNEDSSDQDKHDYSLWKKRNKLPFSCVSSKKINRFLLSIERKESNKDNKQTAHCVTKMRRPLHCMWNSPICLLKAITDSIIRRKWYNLTQLLYILTHMTKVSYYKPIIFEYCDKILNKYHPLIIESGLKDQFTMILRAGR